MRVAVNGASGGVGTFAVQLAVAYGAHVTAVASTGKLDLVRRSAPTRSSTTPARTSPAAAGAYDVIIDVAGTHSLRDYRRALRPGGTLVLVGGPPGEVRAADAGRAGAEAAGQREAAAADGEGNSRDDLDELTGMIEDGRVTPRRHVQPLDNAPAAVARLSSGRARGKVVISIDAAAG